MAVLRRALDELIKTPTALAPAELATHMAALQAAFVAALGPEAAARFELPDELRLYLEAAGGAQYDRSITLWSLAGMIRSTESWMRIKGGEDPEERPADGPWIHVASYGDKHWLFLCCDRAHAEFGHVAEGYDLVPWMDEEELEYNLRYALVDPWGDESPPEARWSFFGLLELLTEARS